MASAQKISALTTAGPLTGAELVPVVQNGGTLQTTVSTLVAFANVSLIPVVSALQTQITQVSDQTSANTAAITSVNAVVDTFDVRIDAVSAAVVSVDAVISALDTRVGLVSAATSVNAAAITSINAEVSLKVYRSGDYMDNVQYIEFDTSTLVSSSAGRLSWSLDEGTLDIGFDNQGVVLHAGLQLYQRVYNDTAATLTKGTVIRVTGSQGQRLTAAPALANNDANSATTFAVMAENVSVNNSGFAVTEGVLKNVNTHTIPDGATLWLSPTSAGQYTPTKPVAPQHLVLVGFVVKGNSTGAGSIYVKIINGFELGELHDVKVSSSTSLANGEVLAYDTSAGVWTNSTALINAQASISALNIQMAAVQASVSAINSALAAIDVSALAALGPQVSTLTIRVDAVSALASANAAAITSTNNVVSALEIRVSAVSAAVVSVNAVVSSLDVRVSVLEAAISAIGDVSAIAALVSTVAILDAEVSVLDLRVAAVSALTSVNAAAITSINNVVSALEIRVSAASATGVTNAAAITSINNVVSALEIRVSAASATGVTNAAAITSINDAVSALEIRVSAASATGVTNAAAITSINNVVSALEVRVSAVSATAAANTAAITSVNNVVSAVQAQVNAVSVSVTQRVLKAGDSMTGELNMQDNLVTRPKVKDYALQLVARGSVSTTTTLDLVEGNFFSAQVAGSTTFVFANPPVSTVATGGAAGGFVLELQNGGAATVTWPSTVDWPGGTAPALTASGFDVIVCITDDAGTNWRCVQSMRDSK